LLELVEHADVDGVAPGTVHPAQLAAALARFDQERTPEARDEAELLLSRTLADYTRAMRTVSPTAMIYEHPVMQPRVPSAAEALWEAARAPSIYEFVHNLQWMHPMYAQLRQALMSGRYVDEGARTALLANMNRVRAIPANPGKRYVLVDAANARLWMYENGQPVDSMKVVVGKPDWQTPMMAGYLRYAIVNPYWNVPPSIVRERTARMVVNHGLSYLKASKFEVLSDFSPDAVVIDPATVDWKAAAAGDIDVRIRQLPMPSNSMGAVKFEFPNQEGIYLHDTPELQLMKDDVRQFSHGCIRLEDAQRFGRWLFGQPLPARDGPPEQKLDVADPVPIYVTYFTAIPGPAEVTFVKDRYKRDVLPQSQMAVLSGISTASR
jgi:murein L,D-transpeptidase YcbB/YkuD